MSDELRVVTAFVAALAAKDIELAETMMAADIHMESPMGPRDGIQACGALLRRMVKAGSSPMDPPQLVDGEIVSINHAPVGRVGIIFKVAGGKIHSVGMKTGV